MSEYLITGATGFLGSAIVNKLLKKENVNNEGDSLTVLVRDEEKARKMFGNRVNYLVADLSESIKWDCKLKEKIRPDYIIHCASVTSSKEMIEKPVETADGIVIGTKNILELCKACKDTLKSVVCLSSMEVYGEVEDTGIFRSEDELGQINMKSVRSCYPLGKRTAEHYCFLYHKEYGVPVKVARLAQVFGTGVLPRDNRVFMQFSRCVIEGTDIVLKTKGDSYGNYCSTEDALEAICLILEKGTDGETYNVVNEENTMTIKEMADLVINEVANKGIGLVIKPEDAEVTGFAPHTELKMSSDKLKKLGWIPTKNLVQMYYDVISQIQKW